MHDAGRAGVLETMRRCSVWHSVTRRRVGRCLAAVIVVAIATTPGPATAGEPATEPKAEPKAGSAATQPATTSDALLEKMLPPRSDSLADWSPPRLALHDRGEPRLLPPCVPPAPCHPAYPPQPFDLIGVAGAPTCGPRYRGPCEPRLGTHAGSRCSRVHAVCDAAFDLFYR